MGTTYETLFRMMNELARERIIHLPEKYITDKQKLHLLSAGA